MLNSALQYAANGWQVFPIREAGEKYRDKDGNDKTAIGKEPGTAKGFKEAVSDPAQIQKWWGSKPRRNIAIRTCEASGIWVLDSDDGGEETIRDLEREFGSLPPCPVQKTPSGGIHRIFKWPADGHIPRRIRFAIGLDALGERPGGKGGYFVIAPSIRSDGRYEWIENEDMDPPPAPQWLVDMVRAAGPAGRNVDAPRVVPVKSGRNNAWGEKALDECAREVATAGPGSQNDTLYKRSCRVGSIVYGGSLDERYAFGVMVNAGLSMANQAGREPWTEQAVAGIVRRGFAWGAQDPNPAPERGGFSGAFQNNDGPPVIEDGGEYFDAETGQLISEQVPEIPNEEPKNSEPDADVEKNIRRATNEAFQCLGYDRGTYYYLPRGTGQITALRASEHSALRLLELAGMDWWQALNDGKKVEKGTWLSFANALMRKCEDAGIFSAENRMRGRGAWIDGKKVVVNTGSEARISETGKPEKTVQLNQVNSRFIYEAGDPWEFGFSEAASSVDAHRLVQICERLTWEDRLSGALLAGWMVIAPVSGALKWRPHIWITGPSGSGKSTVMDIIGRIVGPSAEKVDGKVTEAAIRQLMGFDARPVIFDEAEGESQSSLERMQSILDLARYASSGGRIPKGGSNGKVTVYIMRSAFCFSAINTSVRERADQSRISRLGLRPNMAHDADEHFIGLVNDIDAWLTEEFAGSLFSRTVKYLPVLLKNIETFRTAAAKHFKSRRNADQIAPMLAGYYLCHKTDEIGLDKAIEYIARHEWSDYIPRSDETDEMQMLQFIVTRPIRVEHANGGMVEMTIASALAEVVAGFGSVRPYQVALGQHGIKYADGFIAISASAENTRALFKLMPKWQSDWKGPLRLLPGAMESKGTERFPGGIYSRAVWIPYGHVVGNYREREVGEEG